jgi:hypothetical protein
MVIASNLVSKNLVSKNLVSKNLVSKDRSRALHLLAAIAGGMLMCAVAQGADAAAIKAPVGGQPISVTEAAPAQTDYGCRRGRCRYPGYGYYRRYEGYRGY